MDNIRLVVSRSAEGIREEFTVPALELKTSPAGEYLLTDRQRIVAYDGVCIRRQADDLLVDRGAELMLRLKAFFQHGMDASFMIDGLMLPPGAPLVSSSDEQRVACGSIVWDAKMMHRTLAETISDQVECQLGDYWMAPACLK